MRIQFKTEGGLVYLPGLNRPVMIDLADLPLPEADELQELLVLVRFFELPLRTGKSLPKAADHRQYKITIENAVGDVHTVFLTDVVEDPNLRRLLDYLKKKAAPSVKKSKHGRAR